MMHRICHSPLQQHLNGKKSFLCTLVVIREGHSEVLLTTMTSAPSHTIAADAGWTLRMHNISKQLNKGTFC